jgi:tetratricopeptide (TPR) repeat protein
MEDKYQIAEEYFNKNDIDNAESVLLEMLRENPEDYDVYNFLGIIQMNKKEYQRAINYFEKVLPVFNNHFELHYNLGLAYQLCSVYDKAIAHYSMVLEYVPTHYDALNNMGLANLSLKNYEEANKFFSICLTINPNDPKVYNNIGNLLFAQDQHDEAVKYYNIAAEKDEKNYEYYFNVANCFAKEENYELALENYKKALVLKPDHIQSVNQISDIYNKIENYSEAEKCFNTLVQKNPADLGTMYRQGMNFLQEKKFEDAKKVFNYLYELNFEKKSVCSALAEIYRDLNIPELENKYAEEAESDSIDKAVISTNVGVTKFIKGEFAEALKHIDNALEINPDLYMAHYNKAHIHLLLGEFELGWKEYEWRIFRPDFIQRKLPKEKMLTNQDVANKKVFIYDEQGLGDSIQFTRYLPMLKEKGCSIIFECDKRLKSLYKQYPFIDILIESSDVDEPPFYYDYHLPLLTLPGYFKTDIPNIPAGIPYIRAEEAYIRKWKPVFNNNYYKVGIVWAGSATHAGDRKRSVTLNHFNSIAQIPGVKLYSIQKGNATNQIAKFNNKIVDLDALGLNSFLDTAAVISQLDLVITVDTSVAHLAGAMGKETWILISFLPDWRWLLERSDSPWYPTVKLFRQPIADDWDSAFANVHTKLESVVKEKYDGNLASINSETAFLSDTIQDSNKYLYLGLIKGEQHGWGVCSNYLIKELSKLGPTYLIENIENLEEKESIEGTVFQALVDTNFNPLYRINSKKNCGYTFFETELTDTSIENSKMFDKIFAGSTWCRDKLRDKEINNCDLLIQGVDPEIFYPEDIPTNPNLFVIFSGGKFELRKGQDLVLKAVSILQKKYKNIILMNSWTNSWEKSFSTMAYSKYITFKPRGNNWQEIMNSIYADNNIDMNRVFTLPMLDNKKMRDVYLKTDMGLFTNRCEGGTNLVLMEYMAMGKPVVASYNTGHKDILTNDNSLMITQNREYRIYSNDNKLLFDWKEPDLDEIIERIEYAYHNREELKTIGRNAGEYMKDYSWEKMAVNLYSKLFN